MRESPRLTRESMRLQGFDYSSPAAYFVTACTAGRKQLFGKVHAGEMLLNTAGQAALAIWEQLPQHYAHIRLDSHAVMPNHFHAILHSVEFEPASTVSSSVSHVRHSLSEIMRNFKTFSARAVNEILGRSGTAVWQRSFFDHIIRDELGYEHIREYIANNPLSWYLDRENQQSSGSDPFADWLENQELRPLSAAWMKRWA